MVRFKKIQLLNRSVFATLVVIGLITMIIDFIGLQTPSDAFDAGQSRLDFRWGVAHTIYLVIIFLMVIPLILEWKRLFPYNTPFAIIICGLCYCLIYLTFTVGWVGQVGLVGFAVSFLAGIILINLYSILSFLERRGGS